MKKRIFLVLGILAFTLYLTSCLDDDDNSFVPKIAETNNSYYGKDGDNDSVPPPEDTDTTERDTGGETGQNPIKP